MKTPADKFPDDFDPSQLAEPKSDTISKLEEVCIRLCDLGDVSDQAPPESDNPYIYYTLERMFNNGSKIVGDLLYGSDEWLSAFAERMATRYLTLVTEDGAEYRYADYNGVHPTSLIIKKPGQTAPREVNTDTTKSIEAQDSDGLLSIRIHGAPEVMRGVHEALAKRREARQLGLDKPTEGTMKEFIAAVQAAIDSGVNTDDEWTE